MNKIFINVNGLQQIRTKKISFKGETKDMPVYRIPIEYLYYNDMNGRIATFISQYKTENKNLTKLDNERYNDLIGAFIKDSNSHKRFNKTKEDIRLNTQKEGGVVLTDGRIIDGNRRFACLRELYAETGDSKFAYFEAIVLPTPADDDDFGWKEINSLELELQIGTDEKVDYSPIDWLVKVYQDIVKGKYYKEKEYARLTKYSESDVKKMVIKAEIMEDFLEFFNKPEQFFYAKRLELDGPLTELVKVRRKLSQSEWDENKVPFYVYLRQQNKGDKSREIRNMVKLLGTPQFDKILNDASPLANDILSGKYQSNVEAYKTSLVNSKEPIKNPMLNYSFNTTRQNAVRDNQMKSAMLKPITCCEDALKKLNDIDNDIIKRWKDESTKDDYKNLLNDLATKIEELKKHVS